MLPFDFARFGGEPERLRCNAEQTRRLVQIKPWLVPIWRRPKDRDLIMRPERGDPLPCPAIALAGHQAVPVEDAGDTFTIGTIYHLATGVNHDTGYAVESTATSLLKERF